MRHADAATVATIAYRDLMKGRRVIIPGAFYQAFRIIMKFVPQGLVSDLRARRRRITSLDRH
jgi:short-subunit dehydrogenase